MAAVAQSAVTEVSAWREGGLAGKRFVSRQLTIVLSSQGGATNFISAAICGLFKIMRSGTAIASDNSAIYPTSPSADGTKLLIGGGSSNAPQDISKTVTVVVSGIQL